MSCTTPSSWNSQQLAHFLSNYQVSSSVIQSCITEQLDGCQFVKEPLASLHRLGIYNQNLINVLINDLNEVVNYGYSSSYIDRRLCIIENDLFDISMSSSSSSNDQLLVTSKESFEPKFKQPSHNLQTSIDNLQQIIEHTSVEREYLTLQHEKSASETTRQISVLHDQILLLEGQLLESHEKYDELQALHDAMMVATSAAKAKTENLEISTQTEEGEVVSNLSKQSQTDVLVLCHVLTDTFDLTSFSDPLTERGQKPLQIDAETQVESDDQPAVDLEMIQAQTLETQQALEAQSTHEAQILELQNLLTNEQKETRQLKKKIKEQDKKFLQVQNDFRLQTQDLVTEVQILTDEMATLRSERSNLRHSLSFSNDNLHVAKVAMAGEVTELKQEVSTWRLTAESLTQQLKESREELDTALTKQSTKYDHINTQYDPQSRISYEREQFQVTLQQELEKARENDRIKEASYQANIDHLTTTIHELTTAYTSLMAAVTSGLATNSPLISKGDSPLRLQTSGRQEDVEVERELFTRSDNTSHNVKPHHITKKDELARIYDPASFSSPTSPESNNHHINHKPRSRSNNSSRRPSTSASSSNNHNNRNHLVLSTIHSKQSSPVGDLLDKLRQRYGDVEQVIQQQLDNDEQGVRLTQLWPPLRIGTNNADITFVTHVPEAPSGVSRPSTAGTTSRTNRALSLKVNIKSGSNIEGGEEVPRHMSPKSASARQRQKLEQQNSFGNSSS